MRTVSTHTYYWDLPFNDNNFELQVSCPPEVAEWLDKRIGQQKVERQEQRLRDLESHRSELDCRYAGQFAEFSGSHCPLDKPCERCSFEKRIQELEIKCAEQKKQITKFKQAIDAYRIIRER